MNAKIRRMKREIERRGGVVHLNDGLPDRIVQKFLEEILACPDCAGASRILAPRRAPAPSTH